MWIAEYDTQGMEFPTCVHVTKTTGTMTHGATYVPIEEGKAVRVENAKLRELVNDMRACFRIGAERDGISKQWCYELFDSYTGKLRELGIEVD